MKKPPADLNKEAGKVIDALRTGQSGIVEQLYDKHRGEFIKWAGRHFYTDADYAEDAWQEAAAVFYEQVRAGRLKALRCSVKTFLFAVGHKWLLKNNRKIKRMIWKSELDREIEKVQVELEDHQEEERLLLRAAMKQLPEKCREMLTQRHYHERSIQELMETFDMDANNVSSNLSQCLSKLKRIIKEKTSK